MPGKPGPPAHAPVAFDEAAWSEDLRNSTDAGRAAATKKRAELERNGQPVKELLACETQARDGTSLPECVKTRIPWPNGKWGIVYLIARDKQTGRLSLDILAFGIRHHPKDSHALDVYETADRRLHNAIIARDLRTEKPPTTPNDQTQDG
jgi:hypothetical protein